MFNDDATDDLDDLHSDWPAMRDATLADLELRIGELDEQSSGTDLLLWLDRSAAFVVAAKAVRDAVYRAAIAWINANGVLRVNDQIAFTVGHTRTTRCLDVGGVLHAALATLEGDLDGIAALLSANAWKHGACRQALAPAAFDRLFVTEIRDKLLSGASAPPSKLVRIDERYVRRGR